MGRETQSLTMMVTPSIVIQEEEEEKLGIEDTETSRRVRRRDAAWDMALASPAVEPNWARLEARWPFPKTESAAGQEAVSDVLLCHQSVNGRCAGWFEFERAARWSQGLVGVERQWRGAAVCRMATRRPANALAKSACRTDGGAAGQAGALAVVASAETAYWNPSITTGKDGRATVTFAVPERSTAWRLLAKGITTDTLAGEATESLVVKKELFGQLKLPQSITDGDKIDVLRLDPQQRHRQGPDRRDAQNHHRRQEHRGEEDDQRRWQGDSGSDVSWSI